MNQKIPYYGERFGKLVEASRACTIPLGEGSREYETIREEFDIAYYLMRYADIAHAKRLDPIRHYLEYGADEGRNPSPDFSTKHYVQRYPDVLGSSVNPFYHWLTIGRKEGRLAAPFSEFESMCEIIGCSPQDVQEILSARQRDLRNRFEYGVLGEMVKKASELEPLVAHSWCETFTVKLPPFHSDIAVSQVVAIHQLHKAAEFRRAKAVVIIPHCRLSGAARFASYVAFGLAVRYGPENLAIVRTDLDTMNFPEWFPEGCRQIDFVSPTENLTHEVRQQLLMEFLRSLRPEIVFNVNSRLFWDMLKPYGRALAASVALYTCLFCNDKNIYGHSEGYPLQMFYRFFDILAGIATDSEFLVQELLDRYLVPPEQKYKIAKLEAPVMKILPAVTSPIPKINPRPQVFWAGRFDRQKRIDIVYALAERLPQIDFNLWGAPVLKDECFQIREADNIKLNGVYKDISDLPLKDCDLWLYTSEWDGVPNILIEIAALGIPIVGSIAGGTGEILLEGMSWPVNDIDNIDAYEAGIQAVIENSDYARTCANQLRDYVIKRRTTHNFLSAFNYFIDSTLTIRK